MRSEAIIPHETESASKFSSNIRPREGNLHSADNKDGAAWIFTLLWHWLLRYGFTICSNQINWKRASKEFSKPVTLGGVGNAQITLSHWTYQVKISLFNGNDAVLSGVCLDQTTVEFPKYPVKGLVEADVRNGYISNGKDPKYLPKLQAFVEGHIDVMIGVKYSRNYPKKDVPITVRPSLL